MERLGRHLVATDPPDRRDIEELHRLLAGYGPALASAVDAVAAEIGFAPSSRIKTTGAIIEKLRRNGGHTLSSIQDLGGMRVVLPGGRIAQDEVAQRIREVFADGERPPRLVDRRVQPVQGYRALHVIVYPDGYPIEVQLRTELQHQWAEWFERLADQYGRGIRYGEPPARGGDGAQEMVDRMIQMADEIAEAEESGGPLPVGAAVLSVMDAALNWLRTRQARE